MREQASESSTMLEPPILLTFVVSQVVGIAALVFTVLASVIDNDHTVVDAKEDPAVFTFVWHPVLMSFGLTYLFGSSAVIFRVIRLVDKFHTKLLHMVVHMAALAFSLAGFTLAVQMYNANNSAHFQSVHGMLGVATVALFASQWVISIPVFLWPKAPSLIRAPIKSIHVCLGIGLFVCAAMCSLTGFNSHAGRGKTKTSQTFYKVSALLNVGFTLVILYMLTLRKYKRPPDTY